jgi:hypothetical protein
MAEGALAFIDRIEDGVAVLVLEAGGEVRLPRALLPAGSVEGDAVRIALAADPAARDAARAEVKARRARLAGDDDGGDLKL